MSNERRCSHVLQIACRSGEYLQLGFALDGHDRECLAWIAAARDLTARYIQRLMHTAVAQRFGAGARPEAPIQWLSDNGSIDSALETVGKAERHHLEPITPPVRSPESNGMSEPFVNPMKRNYVSGADRSTAGRWSVLPTAQATSRRISYIA